MIEANLCLSFKSMKGPRVLLSLFATPCIFGLSIDDVRRGLSHEKYSIHGARELWY